MQAEDRHGEDKNSHFLSRSPSPSLTANYLSELAVFQLANKLPACYVARKFIIVVTKGSGLVLFRSQFNQSASSHSTPIKSTLLTNVRESSH